MTMVQTRLSGLTFTYWVLVGCGLLELGVSAGVVKADGLVLSAERSIEGFEDNYFLVFAKPDGDTGTDSGGTGK